MSAALVDCEDRLSSIVTKLIERAALPYGAREALDVAVAECRRRGLEMNDQAVSRARVAARTAVAARKSRREAAEREADERDRAEIEAYQARKAPDAATLPGWVTDEPSLPADSPLAALFEQVRQQAHIEDSRTHAGMPSQLLRWIDYRPGQAYSPPTWLVKNLLPGAGLGLIYGESQAGKSFLALHAALCVAWGAPLFGKRAKPGGVLYIAAEGGSGVLPRLEAAENALEGAIGAATLTGARKPLGRAPMRVVVQSPNLSRDGDPQALTKTVQRAAVDFHQEGSRLALVVIDTWHASLAGADEQGAADTGHALKPLKELVEQLGAFVLIVHHPGKDLERGARGSNSLPADVDTILELRVPGFEGSKAKPAGMRRRVSVTKQRDGALADDMWFRLRTVEIGRDEDGDPWTTCTVEPCDAAAMDAAGKPKGKGDVRFMKAVEAAIAQCGGERADMKVARGLFNNMDPDEKVDAKRKAWVRALDKARDAGLVETDTCDQFIWLQKGSGQ